MKFKSMWMYWMESTIGKGQPPVVRNWQINSLTSYEIWKSWNGSIFNNYFAFLKTGPLLTIEHFGILYRLVGKLVKLIEFNVTLNFIWTTISITILFLGLQVETVKLCIVNCNLGLPISTFVFFILLSLPFCKL